MTIETVRLADINPYARNAKKHPQSQIEQIKQSIQEFGNNDPIAIDENNTIIEGHGRYFALQQLGTETVEAIRLTGMTEEQKKAYILVHNKLTMNTGFDPEILRQEIERITSIDLGIFDLEIDTQLEPVPIVTDAPTPELVKFNLTLSEEQYQELMQASESVDFSTDAKELHRFGNPNKRNNLIFEVIYQWAEQKRLL